MARRNRMTRAQALALPRQAHVAGEWWVAAMAVALLLAALLAP